ncbi:DNA polymerase III subunit gamma/tau [Methylomarinum sp. Ch1-1]|uniref:DNA polymerase III subunit gamma/tau n=1 Tax=Methylomarinum roseum TaxID=3067653 RepID=A0AAU7NPU3_9GAMM|nr:DNA polymerase III subunit gamma/tau [Methylomarinum sp. Ch1-1]MDP4521101.1 DNA polymerase III subunit gamma/tau [Methylomarinum sp. Ch1-1]
MTYQVLARKWRPQNFSQIVGQEHVSQSLIHALQHDRLHHAYLFTGTRGVGKTTIARILAKAINCENLNDFNPCGQCRVCQDFEQGRFMDLIEVDAASRTKVEDTRDLLDNAQYAPNQGRYKVYLIDEVHMLSGHSFNALLKTLEEPPPHVKFLLATTDPQKIPVTVLSRCLQFNLKRLLPDQIDGQMRYILGQEQIEFEESAIKILARAADGSMRDGLSLLDQAIAFGSGAVRYDEVAAMLGTVAQQPVDELLQALVAEDGGMLLAKVDEIANLTPDFSEILQQLLRVLHRVALTQQVPGLVDHEFDKQVIDHLASQLSPENVQLYYQIALIGQRDMDLAPDPRSGFEMILLRMLTFKPKKSALEAAPAAVQQPRPSPAPVQTKPASVPEQRSAPAKTAAPPPVEPLGQAQPGDDNWMDMIQAMKIRGMTRELANQCVYDGVDDSGCRLIIDPSHQHLLGGKAEEKLQKALQDYFGKPLKLRITTQKTDNITPAVQHQRDREQRQQAAVDAIDADQNVQVLNEQFGARVMSGTIEPNDE